jgi:hypothetical protein
MVYNTLLLFVGVAAGVSHPRSGALRIRRRLPLNRVLRFASRDLGLGGVYEDSWGNGDTKQSRRMNSPVALAVRGDDRAGGHSLKVSCHATLLSCRCTAAPSQGRAQAEERETDRCGLQPTTRPQIQPLDAVDKGVMASVEDKGSTM